MAKKYNLTFLYRDFRPGFREGQAEARELGLYMQKYCGCVFSEENSKFDHIKKDKEESARANWITEKKIRLSDSIGKLDFSQLKRENKQDVEFLYKIKIRDYQSYIDEHRQEWTDEIQNKLFERYIKEKAKSIRIITIGDERVGFFDGKILKDDTFEIDNIYIIKEYQNKGIENAILKEVAFENEQIKNKNIKDYNL